jgi:hypothetical protein
MSYFYVMIFNIATFKIKIQCRQPALFKFSESFYMNYNGYRSNQTRQTDFTIIIAPHRYISLPFIKCTPYQGNYYYKYNKDIIIESGDTIACVSTMAKKMTVGFKGKSNEFHKNMMLMAFVRLAVSLCAVLKGGLPFHSSAIAFHNYGIAFTGPSGAGKSTIAKLLASQGQLLNDDFNIILPHGKNIYRIYSTPFAKQEMLKNCVNYGTKLHTIFFIEKGMINTIEDLSFKKKFILLLKQTFIFSLSDFFGNKILDNAEKICKKVECKQLHFTRDGSIRPYLCGYMKDHA